MRYEWENSPVTNLPYDGKIVSYKPGTSVEIDKTYKKGDTVGRREGTYTFSGWTIDGKAAEDFKIEANTVIRGVWTFKAAEVERAARYMIKHVYEGNDNLTSFESGDFDPEEKPAFETELKNGRFDKLMQGAYQVVERTYEGSYENAHGDIIFKYQISYKLADEKDPNYCYMLQHTYQGSSNLDHMEQGMLENKQAYEVALHSGLFDSTLQGAYQVVERRYEGSNKNANGDIVFHYTIVYKLADEKEPNTVYSLRHVYEGNDNLTSYDTGVLGNKEGELSKPMFEQDLHAARYDKTLQGAYQVVERTYEGSYKNGNGDIVFTYQISYKLAEGKESNAYYVIKHIYEGSSNLNIDENGAMEDEAAFQQTVDSGRYDRTLQGAYRVVSRVANDPYINANNDKIYIYEITYRLADEKEPNTYYSLKHVYEGNDNLNSYDNGYLSNEEGQLSKPMFEQDLYSGRYDKLQQGAYQVVERTYEGSQKNGNGDIIFTYLITYRMTGSHESSNTYYSLKHLYQGNDTLTSYENGELSEEEGQLSKTAFEQNLENGQFDKTQQGAYRIVSRVAEGSTVNANGDTVYMYVINYERITGGGNDDDDDDGPTGGNNDNDDDDDIIEEEVDDNETPLTGLPGGDGQQTGDNGQNGQTSGTEEEVLDEEVPLANLPEQPEDGKNLPKTGGVVGAGLALVGLASVGGGMLLRRKDEENETGEDK